MRYYSLESVLPYSWHDTAIAFWHRYPNAYSKHVLSDDVLYRAVEDGRLRTVRLLTKTARMPRWGERFFDRMDRILVVEESIVNLADRSVTSYTRNIDYLSKRIMSIEEKCTIKPHRDSRASSVLRQAWICAYVRGLVRVLERFGYERFKHNAANAAKGYLATMERLYGPSKMTASAVISPGIAAKIKCQLHQQ